MIPQIELIVKQIIISIAIIYYVVYEYFYLGTGEWAVRF